MERSSSARASCHQRNKNTVRTMTPTKDRTIASAVDMRTLFFATAIALQHFHIVNPFAGLPVSLRGRRIDQTQMAERTDHGPEVINFLGELLLLRFQFEHAGLPRTDFRILLPDNGKKRKHPADEKDRSEEHTSELQSPDHLV